MSASLLEIAGAETPDHHQGYSLLPYLTGERPLNEPIRDAARSEYFDALAPAFTQGKRTFATMHRDSRYKLVVYHSINKGELFDLEADPQEHNNLWENLDSVSYTHLTLPTISSV